jgi:hypothetical protein
MTDNQESKPSKPQANENLETTEYLVNAFFESLDRLVIRNRAYHTVLLKLAGKDALASYLKQVEDARASAVEPPVFIDLRRQAIEAVQSRNLAEFLSLASAISERTRAWL